MKRPPMKPRKTNKYERLLPDERIKRLKETIESMKRTGAEPVVIGIYQKQLHELEENEIKTKKIT